MNKLKSSSELIELIHKLQKDNKTIVFTNGCFDIIHAGHIESFKQAKAFGDYLIVAINSDNSIRRLKGEKRPIVDEKNRVKVLEAIEYIDFIVVFNEDSPKEIIEKIKPNFYVKGSDWKNKILPEQSSIDSYGGKIAYVDLVDELSTTNIIKKIFDAYSINL